MSVFSQFMATKPPSSRPKNGGFSKGIRAPKMAL